MSHKAVMNPASVLITVIFITMAVIKHHQKKKREEGSIEELSSIA